MPIPAPTIIQGPAIAQFQGGTFYFRDSITVTPQIETFNVTTDFHGVVDERLKSLAYEISGTPCGAMDQDALDVLLREPIPGMSIFAGGDDQVLVIHSLAGDKHTFHRAGITGIPQLRMKPTDSLLGPVKWTSIGLAATQPTDAAFISSVAAAAFDDASFDDALIKTGRYQAAWGGDAPYNAMSSLAGFMVDFDLQTSPVPCDDFGIADIVVVSYGAKASFVPANLSLAQVNALVRPQGASVLLPGESFTKAGNDLVIEAADVFKFTLSKCGPKFAGQNFAVAQHRHTAIEWATRKTWTAGARNALWTAEVL